MHVARVYFVMSLLMLRLALWVQNHHHYYTGITRTHEDTLQNVEKLPHLCVSVYPPCVSTDHIDIWLPLHALMGIAPCGNMVIDWLYTPANLVN